MPWKNTGRIGSLVKVTLLAEGLQIEILRISYFEGTITLLREFHYEEQAERFYVVKHGRIDLHRQRSHIT